MKSMLKKISRKFGGGEKDKDKKKDKDSKDSNENSNSRPSSGSLTNSNTNGNNSGSGFGLGERKNSQSENSRNSITMGTPPTGSVLSQNQQGQGQPGSLTGSGSGSSNFGNSSTGNVPSQSQSDPNRNSFSGNSSQSLPPLSNNHTQSSQSPNLHPSNPPSQNYNSVSSNASNNNHSHHASSNSSNNNQNANNSSNNNNNNSVNGISIVSSSAPNGLTKNDLLKPVPPLNDNPITARPQAFIYKLRLCCVPFEWRVGMDALQDRDAKPKENKRQHLLDIVEYVGKNTTIYTENVLTEIMNLFQLNLFRALPATLVDPTAPKGEGGDEDEPLFDPSWPHLQVVYELLLRFIMTADVDVKLIKKFINGSFIQRLLELFDSEDHRERDYLKTILHRIYAKFMSLRAFIRKAINHVFFIFIYEKEKHNGIAELLEILGSIINGFALPLKAEHKTFLQRVLVPLHKVRCLSNFHQQLAYCVSQFVDKDPTLAVPVISGLLKFWPHTSTAKQLLFLNELEELLELTQPAEFKIITGPLCRQLSVSITSPHFQVSERALFLWHNEYISGLINEQRNEILPILFPALSQSSHHWNQTVTSLAINVLKSFADMDQALWDQCDKSYTEKMSSKAQLKKENEEGWSKIKGVAEKSAIFQAITNSNSLKSTETSL